MVTLKHVASVEIKDADPEEGLTGMWIKDFFEATGSYPTHKVAVRGRIPLRDGTAETYLTFMAIVVDDTPVLMRSIHLDPVHAYWLYEDAVYRTDDFDLTPEDVRALLNVQKNQRRLKLEKAHALQAMADQLEPKVRRERIPQDVKVFVWQRDKGRCVECESQTNLEFDHVIPVVMGGSNTARNLQLLCETCNRRKGASLG